ncbi:FixH family protein [Cerasibacillus terrae]|nr:FixH family protein [Cerasibacillus terrae]
MKKIYLALLTILVILLTACGAEEIEWTVKQAPVFKPEVASEMIIEAKKEGEALTGLEISGLLEMERMDHGIIEIVFTDNGDGTYSGEVELPMGGEWIIDLQAQEGDTTYEDVITFDVDEG